MNIKIQTLNTPASCLSARRLKSFLLACVSFCTLLYAHEAFGQNQQRAAKQSSRPKFYGGISEETLLRIMRAEDERRWDDLSSLLTDRDVRVRERAALAAGRIGDERAVPLLITLLGTDAQQGVRTMSAFALGETELPSGADALMNALQNERLPVEVRARSIEALGKIAAALPKSEEAKQRTLSDAILKALSSAPEGQKTNREFVLLGLTAVLRSKPANASGTVARFLKDPDARTRADALNTLARLKAKDLNEQVRALLNDDADAVVRANAARVLGVAEDAASLDALVARATTDADERVRVSAIRALGSLKQASAAAAPLLEHAAKLMALYRAAKKSSDIHPREANELLEIATTLGRLLANTGDVNAVAWLRAFRDAENWAAPEIEIAFARIAPASYLRERPFTQLSNDAERARFQKDWRTVSAVAQGLGEIAALTAAAGGNGIAGVQADAQIILKGMLDGPMELPALAVPDVLRALAAFKGGDLGEVLRKQLEAKDVIVRATAAELLGELPPDEANTNALASALPVALKDELNDAALSILDSLAKQKSASANESMKAVLDSPDSLVRRRAAALLKANAAGDFDARIGAVATRNKAEDYQRALERFGKIVRASVTTDKGAFTIELLPEDAPLNVDNFVQLARRGYFNNITFHRVVPNFVVQGGDPRGDGNGGPGYQIRCEINEVPYERGAVGMALSGKDTGGSQWFVTHSPQPHLDGGYTVFGRVVAGMEVVDQIARGDRIRSINVTETARPVTKEKKKSR